MTEFKLVDITQNFILPKYLLTGDLISKLFSVDNFGKKYAGLYWTYIALKITSFQYGNQVYDFWFYRSAKDIGKIARLSAKQVQRYIQALIRLELILAIKNPGKKNFITNPGLRKLFEGTFKKLPNKPIYFFRISNLSETAIEEAILKAKDVCKWYDDKYHLKVRSAKARVVRKMKEAGFLDNIQRA